jgi:kumamolisin
MGLAGTVEDVNAAFGVTLFDYTHPKLGDFRARTGPVHIRADMVGAITGVFGLNNHRILRRTFRPARHVAPAMSTPARAWFIPTELGSIYDFPHEVMLDIDVA